MITIDGTHRDLVMAGDHGQATGYTPEVKRKVEFLASYPPDDIAFGQLWEPMREETNGWLARVHSGLETPHTTAADGHRNLMLTMSMVLSTKRGEALRLSVDIADFEA